MKTRMYIVVAAWLWAACTPNAADYFEQARTKLDAGKYQEAVSLLDEAIAADDAQYQYFNARGAAYFSLKKYSEALSDFDRAAALNQTDYKIYYNRGNVNRALDKPQAAVADYRAAIALDSTQHAVYLNRGLAYMAIGDFAAADTDLTRAVNLSNKRDTEALFYFAKNALNVGKTAQAQEMLTLFLSAKPQANVAEAYYLMGVSLLAANQQDKAGACNYLQQAAQQGFQAAEQMLALNCK